MTTSKKYQIIGGIVCKLVRNEHYFYSKFYPEKGWRKSCFIRPLSRNVYNVTLKQAMKQFPEAFKDKTLPV